MNAQFLQRRLFRIVTRPPELLYALTSHWLGVLVCLLAGGVAMWAYITTQAPIYEAVAKYQVLKSSERQQLRATNPRGLDANTVVHSELARTTSVIRTVVQEMEQHTGGDSKSTKEKSLFNRIQKKVSGQLFPNVQGGDGRTRDDTLVDAFLARSDVTPKPGNLLVFRVVGSSREYITKELETWITTYREHALANEVDIHVRGLSEMVEINMGDVQKISQSLEDFDKNNPDVLNEDSDSIRNQIAASSRDLDEYERRLIQSSSILPTDPLTPVPTPWAYQGPGAPPPSKVADDPVLEELDAQISLKRVLRNEAQAKVIKSKKKRVIAEANETIERLNEEIAELEEKREDTLAALHIGGGDDDEEETEESADARYQAVLAKRQREVEALREEERERIRKWIARYQQRLESAKKLARLVRERENLVLELNKKEELLQQARKAEELGNVEPVILRPVEEPRSSVFKTNRLQLILFGCLGGVGVGIGFAILAELLCGKIRFKSDVMDDFQLPVTTVFPK